MADWFVDFDAGVDGDGTSIATCFNTIVGKSFGVLDYVWIRRTGTLTLVADLMLLGARYIGWPKAGDYWNTIFGYGTNGDPWDTDVDNQAIIEAGAGITVSIGQNGNTAAKVLALHRLKFDNPTGDENDVWVSSFYGPKITDCIFRSAMHAYLSTFATNQYILNSVFETVNDTGTNGTALLLPSEASIRFEGCTFKSTGASTAPTVVLVGITNNSQVAFFECDFIATGTSRCLDTVPTLDDETRTVLMNCSFDDSARSSFTQPAILARGSSWARNIDFNGSHVQLGPSDADVDRRFWWWQFASFVQTVDTPVGIKANFGGVLTILNFIPDGSTTDPIVAAPGIKIQITNGSSTLRHDDLKIKDEAGVLGAWHQVSRYGDALKIDSVDRDTGAPFAVKLTYDVDAAGKLPLMVSHDTIYAKLTAGVRTVTIYGAHKSYSSAPTKNDLWFDVDYYDAVTTHRASGSSRAAGALTSDASTWNGDSGLTIFKLVVVITVVTPGIMPIRIYFRKYDAAGYTYLDPKPVVT